MRRTKIICTLGPASDSEEKIRDLMDAGMNVARFNFSHGSHEEHKARFERVIRIRRELGKPVATLLDTKGPEIRLKDFENGSVDLKEGQPFTLTTDDVLGNEERVSVTYDGIANDVSEGGTILIDDGLVALSVEKIEGSNIHCKVMNGGTISNKKGVNIPNVDVSMPFISQKDHDDIVFGCEMGFELLAASFTRTAQDIKDIRKIIKENDGNMKIIAKIESMQGVKNIDEILEEADGVMVARGDLGVEVPLEDVPIIQKCIIRKANEMGKIVVTATQMLDSMIHNPRPTRAEATDVANAIYQGTTAIMLSGETAAGKYPVQACHTMARIAERIEYDINYTKQMRDRFTRQTSTTRAISHAVCDIADDIDAKVIIGVSMSGMTGERISSYHPNKPIVACTVRESVAAQMNVLFGVYPLVIPQEEKAELLFTAAVSAAKKAGFVESGDKVVLAAGVPLGVSGNTNMIRVIEVE
ncbi:pyruvate kinase [Catenisphaera adipataccumulans]|uniref:Pyruvate kinase n=1 Tax=Catenisphaera adipataccumulans TaxID=700500 RepID=A0A7W8CYM4_9FIRM|nr:pyruvate kinase [Catenisphaera adipataccumulans]MBB5183796.1 pyruvate kinase [Catenisphaera adipataccumulans]